MRWLHPSTRTLERWLDGDAPAEVDRHVAECARCATRLDELAAPLPDVSAALTERLRSPDDLVERLAARMTESMRSREDLAILLGLLGIPLGTVRNLLTEDDT